MNDASAVGIPTMKAGAVYRHFLPYLRPYWLLACFAVVMLLGQVVMDVLAPWPIKFVFDSVIGERHVHGSLGWIVHLFVGTDRLALLNLIVAAFIGIALLNGLFSYAGNVLLSNIGQRFVFDVRRDLFAHVQRLSLRFHGSRRTGDLMARLTADISNIQDMVVTAASTIFSNVLTIVLMVIVMLHLDWRYTVLTTAVVPFMYLTARHYRRAIKQATREMRRSEGQVSSIVQEVVSSIRIVKAFTREDLEQQRFETQSGISLQAGLHSAKLQAQFAPIIDLLGSLGTVIVLWVGVREVLADHLTPGELLVFVLYLRAMYSPLRQLAKVSIITARGAAGAERVLDVLNTAPDLHDLPGARSASTFRGRIAFDHVSFGYDPDRLVLHDVSFDAEPRSVTALVGATGSGKTTTVSLIPRFYDPTSGTVRIDGEDLKNYTLETLRAQVSLVLQEPVLFTCSIFDNIAYGNPHASAADIYGAAEAANVTEFIDRLPEGYNTVVGERGATLSGGQRQCIAIARAIVRNAPILILDEPTVGLDAETEALVLEALQRLMANRTTFVIAHHLFTIQRADTIIVLERGRVVESGKHDELLHKNALYAKLYRMQSRTLMGPLVATSSSSG